MEPSRKTGDLLHEHRLEIALEIAERLLPEHKEYLEEFNLNRETIVELAYHDIGNLFVAVVSRRPELFGKYVEWRRSLFFHRNVPATIIGHHLDLLLESFQENFDEESYQVVAAIIEKGKTTLDNTMVAEESCVHPTLPLYRQAHHYLNLSLNERYDDALRYVIHGVEDGIPIKEAYTGIIQPVQREVGRLWQTNEISVAQEHAITDTSRSFMALLRGRYGPQKHNDATILTTCVGGEQHDVGARMVNDFFHLEGFHTVFTGANTPYRHILREIHHSGARILAISTTMSLYIKNTIELIDRTRIEFNDDVRILTGGYAFNRSPSLYREVGADSFADNADAATEEVRDLLRTVYHVV